MSWIVAMTKPNAEAVAAENLRRQGYEHYYPRFVTERPDKTPLVRPLFPRYIFILIDKVWYSIKGTRGISRVLMGDAGPAVLPTAEVERMRQREDAKGLIRLDTAPPKFLAGSRVKVADGPLAGRTLLYAGMSDHDRVKVLIDMLGRQVTFDLDGKTLVAA